MKGIKGTTDEGELDPFYYKLEGKIPQGKIIEKITGVIDLFPNFKRYNWY